MLRFTRCRLELGPPEDRQTTIAPLRPHDAIVGRVVPWMRGGWVGRWTVAEVLDDFEDYLNFVESLPAR